jgi:dolichol-phosphate mannosyltransferase
MNPLKLSIVVPCYNERDGLAELHRRVAAIARQCVGEAYELVLVNDGSTDASWAAMGEMAAHDAHIVAVNLSRNYGHQLALSAGLSLCRGERVFILDADLQDPPELLDKMMARMDAGCDVVYGQRIKRAGETAFKKTTAHIFYRVLERFADIKIPNDAGDFRLMSRRAVDVLNSMPEHHRFIRGMVSWIGLRQEPLAYERAQRFTGETKYPLSKMIRFAIDAITGFSMRPLRIASYLGFSFSLATVALMAYILINYFIGYTVSGWTSLALIILAVSSVQFVLMGVMGEYLGRLYIEAKRRPLFIVQDVVASPELTTTLHPEQAASAK